MAELESIHQKHQTDSTILFEPDDPDMDLDLFELIVDAQAEAVGAHGPPDESREPPKYTMDQYAAFYKSRQKESSGRQDTERWA